MSAVFSGNTTGVSGMCQDFDTNASELNSALADAEILTNGVLTLTQIDGSTFTNNIPYFADFVISGLNLNISNVPANRTLTYTAGTYQINAQVYSIPVGANFQLTAGHPTLPRIDILYLTNTNNIFYQTGTPSVNPVQPTPPAGTLLLAAIGVQINATTSLNYTLVTVNTNASNIVPPVLTPGTVTGSHLYWDSISWSENTFWNVSNSTFDPTARIHTYTDTDSSGVVTTAKLGDSDIERGFYYLVNDVLNGYSTQMELSSDSGSETYFSLGSVDTNLFANSIINNSATGSSVISSNITNDRKCEFSQSDVSNILEANLSTKDPLNRNQFIQNLTSTTSEITSGTNISNINQNILLNQISLSQSSATANSYLSILPNSIDSSVLDLSANQFLLDGTLKANTLSITDGTKNSLISQDTVSEITLIQQDNAIDLTLLRIQPDNFEVFSSKDVNLRGSSSICLNTGITSYNTVGEITIASTDDLRLFSDNSNIILKPLAKINLDGGIIKKQRDTAIATAILDDDWMIISTVALIVTLPAAPDNGRQLIFRSVTGTMTINGNGNNIEATPTTTVAAGNSRTLIFNTALNRWLNI